MLFAALVCSVKRLRIPVGTKSHKKAVKNRQKYVDLDEVFA
jgi:hypothetical protein